jgi:hypothetical protein
MKPDWLRNLYKRLRPMQNMEHTESQLSPDALKQMIRGIVTTRPDEIVCGECFEQVDRFAEMVLAGMDAAEVLPLVQDHLNRCGDCREEFETLLAALRAVS